MDKSDLLKKAGLDLEVKIRDSCSILDLVLPSLEAQSRNLPEKISSASKLSFSLKSPTFQPHLFSLSYKKAAATLLQNILLCLLSDFNF